MMSHNIVSLVHVKCKLLNCIAYFCHETSFIFDATKYIIEHNLSSS